MYWFLYKENHYRLKNKILSKFFKPLKMLKGA